MSTTVRYLTTDNLNYIAKRAEETSRNRQVYADRLAKVLDPTGLHVVGFRMLHNDVEWRLNIMCKVAGSMEPIQIWLDVSFDDYDERVWAREVREPSPLEQLGLQGL